MDKTPGDKNPSNPFEELLRQLGITNASGDPNELMAQLQQQLGPMAQQLQAMFAPQESGGINWDSAKNVARHVVAAAGPDPTPSQDLQRRTSEAFDLANTWLDGVCTLPAVSSPGHAWSRAEWVEATMPTWQRLVEPIVTRIAQAMQASASEGLEMAQMAHIGQILERAAAGMFATQAGQAVGQLGHEVLSATDAGLPLCTTPTLALLSTNVEAFREGLDQPEREVLLFLAVREAARARLFHHVSWLSTQVLALIEHYAREITIDTSSLHDAVAGGEFSDPAHFQEMADQFEGSLFAPTVTEEQKEVLERLETLLALIEGWVDVVTSHALAPWIAQASALSESLRRRRAAGGPAEKTLASLVGLQLRPQRIREAATLWEALLDRKGMEERDDVWEHPDMLPTAADLSDPLGYATGDGVAQRKDALDAEIEDFFLRNGKSES